MQNNFRQGLDIQIRVVFALIMRELLTRYGRHNIGFLWIFIEPMMFTLAVVGLWIFTGISHNSSISVVAFGVTGYSTVMLWRNMPGRAVDAIQPNLSLLTHRPVQVIDVFLARILLEGLGASISFASLSIASIAIGWMKFPEDLLTVLFGWILLAWFGGAFALLIGACAEKNHIVHKIWHPFSYIMFPIAGAAFLVESLPPIAQNLVLYIPMVHCVEMLRDGYFGSLFQAKYNIAYVIICNTFVTLFGLAAVRDLTRRGVYS